MWGRWKSRIESGADDGADGWRERARCLSADGVDPKIFFPADRSDEDAAKAVCAGCPVRQRCLDHAIAQGEWFGVWGGTTEQERRAMRKAAQARQAAGSAGVRP